MVCSRYHRWYAASAMVCSAGGPAHLAVVPEQVGRVDLVVEDDRRRTTQPAAEHLDLITPHSPEVIRAGMLQGWRVVWGKGVRGFVGVVGEYVSSHDAPPLTTWRPPPPSAGPPPPRRRRRCSRRARAPPPAAAWQCARSRGARTLRRAQGSECTRCSRRLQRRCAARPEGRLCRRGERERTSGGSSGLRGIAAGELLVDEGDILVGLVFSAKVFKTLLADVAGRGVCGWDSGPAQSGRRSD